MQIININDDRQHPNYEIKSSLILAVTQCERYREGERHTHTHTGLTCIIVIMCRLFKLSACGHYFILMKELLELRLILMLHVAGVIDTVKKQYFASCSSLQVYVNNLMISK